jgi:invasion protein IalB
MMLVQRAVGLAACVALALGCAWSAPANAQAAKGAKGPPSAKQEAAATPYGPEATLVGQFGPWGVYIAAPGGKKVCFAMAKPSSMKTNPANRPRDPAYAFVSTRPNERVVNEVSVMIGYPLKPGSEGALEVSGNRYAMYTQGDGLWIKNAAEEDKMVDAMRKGQDITIKGVSSRGTETTDTYSLKGLAQALDRLAQDCKR